MIKLANHNVRVLGPLEQLDYYDSQSAALARAIAPLDAWNLAIGRQPAWMKAAFKIRDAISSLFGVKRIGGFSGAKVEQVAAGDRLDFFLVEHSDDTALVLTERDRHLDVMTCVSVCGRDVTITSSVRVHNVFGRAYMIPVGIAHRWIVRGTLRRLVQKVEAA